MCVVQSLGMAQSQPPDWSLDITLATPDQTTALAKALRKKFRVGDVILLSGPIGAGKSHFARALISSLQADFGHAEDIPSPTFTLVQSYNAGDLEIWHSDLYRLTNVDEVVELGLFDAFETGLSLVEWPDRLGADTPLSALSISFALTPNESERVCRFTATDAKWVSLRNALAEGINLE